jgi:hypothetical protein
MKIFFRVRFVGYTLLDKIKEPPIKIKYLIKVSLILIKFTRVLVKCILHYFYR